MDYDKQILVGVVAAVLVVCIIILALARWPLIRPPDQLDEVACQDPECPCEGDPSWHRDADGEYE